MAADAASAAGRSCTDEQEPMADASAAAAVAGADKSVGQLAGRVVHGESVSRWADQTLADSASRLFGRVSWRKAKNSYVPRERIASPM